MTSPSCSGGRTLELEWNPDATTVLPAAAPAGGATNARKRKKWPWLAGAAVVGFVAIGALSNEEAQPVPVSVVQTTTRAAATTTTTTTTTTSTVAVPSPSVPVAPPAPATTPAATTTPAYVPPTVLTAPPMCRRRW